MKHQDCGRLCLNGVDMPLVYATCDLFCGELSVDFEYRLPDGLLRDGGIWCLPCGTALDYSQLDGGNVEAKFPENGPHLNLSTDSYAIETLRFSTARTTVSDELRIDFTAEGAEWDLLPGDKPRLITASGTIRATCETPPGDHMMRMSSIPASAVNFYLRRLGVPPLPERSSRDDVTRIFGSVVRHSQNPGQKHPQFGFAIPDWTIHHFETFGLHCFYQAGYLDAVMVVSKIVGPNGQSKFLHE